MAQKHILHFEEITPRVGAFQHLGVARPRITGGEPLLRRELDVLVAMLASKAGGNISGAAIQSACAMMRGC